MAKTCTVCKQTYPDDLKQCPHCQAKAAAGEANPPAQEQAPWIDPHRVSERGSSGEIYLDAPETDLTVLSQPVAHGPEASDEIVEIDWSAIEDDSSESSSVVDLNKDAHVELEAPTGVSSRPPHREEHPSSAEIDVPPAAPPAVPLATPVRREEQTPPLAARAEPPAPEQPATTGKATHVVAGTRPPTQLAGPAGDPNTAPPEEVRAEAESPSSFTLGKPTAPAEQREEPAAPARGSWGEAELVDIEHLTAGDESSEVDLGSGPRRRGGRTDQARHAADSSSGHLAEAPREERQDDLEPWSGEHSAVDLGSTPDVGAPASEVSGERIGRGEDELVDLESGAEAAPLEEEAGYDDEDQDAVAVEEPDEVAIDEEPVAAGRAKESRAAVSGLVGGVIGAAAATAVCAGLWFAGLLPESRRSTASNPAAAPANQGQPAAAAPAIRENPRVLMDRGDYARVLEAAPAEEGQQPPSADLLAVRGEARWRAYLEQQKRAGQPIQATDQPVEEAKAALAKSNTPEGAFWLGQIQEGTGDLAAARKTYEDALKQYQDKPAMARLFQTALRRLDALEGAGTEEEFDEKKPQLKGLNGQARGPSGPGLALALLTLLGQPPAADKPAAAEDQEAGDYFWEAVQLAKKNQYAEAIHALDLAATTHNKRRFLRQNKSQNPTSDPTEQIFLKCCQELENYWKLRMRLMESGYLDPDKQKSALKAVDNLVKAAKAPKSDPALQAVIDKLKKDKDVTAQDPDVKDVGKDLDVVLEAKRKAREQLAAIESTLADAKYVSEEQPDPVKGLERLLQDRKQAAASLKEATDSLKQAKDSLAALKMGNEALTATLKVLEAEKYITGDQPSIPKGVERLVADKKAAEAKLKEAAAQAQTAENKAKDFEAKVKTAEEKIKDLTTQARTANQKAGDLAARVKSADDQVKNLSGRLKSADSKLEDLTARIKAADETLRAVAAKLATARVVSPDARGADLVRGAEQVARLAVQPRTTAPTPEAPNAPRVQPRDFAPPVRPVEAVVPSQDPFLAEQYFNRGLASYFGRRYGAAEGDFQTAVRMAGPAEDARYFYFLGLAQLALGREGDARLAFREASTLERNNRPSTAAVSASLERVQGPVRRFLDSFRR